MEENKSDGGSCFVILPIYKRLYFIGISAYVVMLVFSLLFYKERTIFLDMAFNLFKIIKDSGFAIQIYRFGDIISQLLPLAGRKAGLSVNTICQLYSVNFVLFFFAAYFICGTVLKRYDFALVVLLLNILFATDTFYWMLSQLPQAIAILIVIFALVSGKQLRSTGIVTWALLIVSLVTVVFFHPLIIFVLIFSLAFFMLHTPAIIDRKLSYAIAIIYGAGMLVKIFLFKTPYEAHSLSGMKNFLTLFPDYFTIFSNQRFLHDCLTKYYWIPVFFAGIAAFYIKTAGWRKLWFFVLFFIAYLSLVNITYPTDATPEFYIENLYLPLAIFLALPFVFDILPMLETKKLATPVILLIMLTGCVRLYTSHTPYTARLDYERNILNEYGDRKVYITAQKKDTTVLMMLWGTPYEFLLLSESERNKPASIIIEKNIDRIGWTKDLRNALAVNWNIFYYRDLPDQYFHFTDSASGYSIIK